MLGVAEAELRFAVGCRIRGGAGCCQGARLPDVGWAQGAGSGWQRRQALLTPVAFIMCYVSAIFDK